MSAPESSMPDPEPQGAVGMPSERESSEELDGAGELPKRESSESLVVEAPTPERDALMRDPSTLCLNCGQALPGVYCPSCGQKAQRLRQPVHLFLRDAIVEFFGLDGRVWKTLGVLLFKPGRLTGTYIQGRRVAYLRPLRIYLSSTLLFFVLLATLDPVRQLETQIDAGFDSDSARVAVHLAENDSLLLLLPLREQSADRQRDSLQARLDSLDGVRAQIRSQEPLSDPDSAEAVDRRLRNLTEDIGDLSEDIDELVDESKERTARIARMQMESALLSTMPPDSMIVPDEIHEITRRLQANPSSISVEGPDWLTRSRAAQQLINARTNGDRAQALAQLVRNAIGHIPTVLFVVLPVFALVLKVLYIRRDWYYSEHLVFGLHTHAFAFIVFALIALVLQFGADAEWGVPTIVGLSLSIPLYFLLAQKHVYRQGWIRTCVKAWFLGLIYMTVISIGLVGAILLAAVIG